MRWAHVVSVVERGGWGAGGWGPLQGAGPLSAQGDLRLQEGPGGQAGVTLSHVMVWPSSFTEC